MDPLRQRLVRSATCASGRDDCSRCRLHGAVEPGTGVKALEGVGGVGQHGASLAIPAIRDEPLRMLQPGNSTPERHSDLDPANAKDAAGVVFTRDDNIYLGGRVGPFTGPGPSGPLFLVTYQRQARSNRPTTQRERPL